MIEEEISIFGLKDFMANITFVTDRGSNFVNGLNNCTVLFCVAHRLNNILKKTFYQGITRKKTSKSPKKTLNVPGNVTNAIADCAKEQKLTTVTTTVTSSPSNLWDLLDEDNYISEDSDESSDDDNDTDPLDYTELTIGDLNAATKQIIDTISQCKSLVKYVKKVLEFVSRF